MELTLKDFMISFLQYEYGRYSHILHNMLIHIEQLFDSHLLDTFERIKHIKTLNDLIKDINFVYNNRLKKLKENNIIEIEDDESTYNKINDNSKIFINSNLKNFININFQVSDNTLNNVCELVDLYRIKNMDTCKELYFDDFDEIADKISKLGIDIGFFNINDGLNVLVGNNFQHFIKPTLKNIFNIYDKIFIPLSYQKNKPQKGNFIKSTLIETEKDIIIDNYAEITINIDNFFNISFKGYYNYDTICVVLRTSQICRQYIFEKKKKLIEIIESLKYIHHKFRLLYAKNLSTAEILSHNETTIKGKIESDYEKYNKYSNMTFPSIMSEFLKDTTNNLKNMYLIIKLLLLGPDECVNVAGLLFGLTKDKKIGSITVADIIYKTLNFTSQSKLKKSSINIKAELEKLKTITSSDIDLKKQVVASKNMPNNIKKLALEKIEEMKSGSTEYYKQSNYVNILLNFPWPCEDDDIFSNLKNNLQKGRVFLNKTKETLNKLVYGHDECKNTMNELIGKWITNPKSVGKAIGLVGPPGVGKTLIAKGLGEALGIPFAQINLGGLDDGSVLSGHSYTYSAAQPGLIIRRMVEAGKSRCVLFFDELDKTSSKHGINEIFNVLIHATDTNTNAHFNDKFFQEVTFPLDKVLFVFSYNDSKLVDKILLDRMEKIEVHPYSVKDKVKIVKNFLLKEISESFGFENNTIDFEDDKDIEYLIETFTFEAGVRELKRKIESIISKLNLDRIYDNESYHNIIKNNKVVLNQEVINKYLVKPNISIKKIHDTDEIGIINGLYATTGGSGGIIPILIYSNFVGSKNRFVLKLTGSQGKVMKESVSFSFTTAMNILKLDYKKQFLKDFPYGLHIHTPDGATPKDGPSAGSAFTTAFISRILGKKIKKDIAMTGEIELNGKITAIGGLQYKLIGAKKAGVKTVFVPLENKEDFDKIKEKDNTFINNDFNVILVSHISEILNIALIENDGSDLLSSNYLDDVYLKVKS